MEVALTARKGKISKTLREQAEEGMEHIGRIMGRTARASITFSAQRHVQIVELTIQSRSQKIAATGKGDSPEAALREALAHAEHQAHRHRDRRIVSKRLPKGEKVMTAPPVARPKARVEPDGRRRRGQTGPRQSAGIHRGALVSCARHGGRAAHPQKRRSHCAETDDD